MNVDIDALKSGMTKLGDLSTSLEKQKTELTEQVAGTKEEVIGKAEFLKELIEKHKEKILVELDKKERKAISHLEELNDEAKQRRSFMETVKLYSEELVKKGTVGDIARDTNALHKRTEELVKVEPIECARNNIDGLVIKFTASSVLEETANAVGDISYAGELLNDF